MAETLTQRIGRMGTGTAHAVALGGVAAVVLVVAGVLAVLGVDTIEVTATLLVIPRDQCWKPDPHVDRYE